MIDNVNNLDAALRGEPVSMTKSEYAYRQVRARVLSGRLPPGSLIQQEDLAREIGVSTTPVREALRRLQQEGLVVLDAHRDARTAPLTAEEAHDLLEARQALDAVAAGFAARRRSSGDVESIKAAAARLGPVVAAAGEAALVAHRDFHTALYRASHNAVLIDMLDDLWDKSDRYRRLGLTVAGGLTPEREQDHREHFAIMGLIVEHRDEEATALMARHVEASVTHVAMLVLSGETSRENSESPSRP